MTRTAVGAPAKSDACNWLPLAAMRFTHDDSLMCRGRCVQHFDMTVAGQKVRMHRCEKHKLADGFIKRLQRPVER